MNPLRVAVIGAGYWGPNLVRNLNEAPGAEPVAVADATPVNTHRKLAEQALAAGKHVFVEKPLAATSVDAEALVRAAEKAGRTLMVGHTFVYNPAVVTVRGLIESGELGRINYVDSQRVNLGLHELDINVLWDLGPHDVSISLYWLAEEPEWVQCIGACYVQPDIEDVVFLTLGFPSGAVAHAHLSWLAPGKLRTMTVIGSKKMAVYDDVQSVERGKVYDFGVEALHSGGLRRSDPAGGIHS